MPLAARATTSQAGLPGSTAARDVASAIADLRHPLGPICDRPFGWLRHMDDARALRALEPRLARDTGAVPGCRQLRSA